MKKVAILIVIGLVILGLSLFSMVYTLPFEDLVTYAQDHKLLGAALLAILMCLSTVVAPLTVLPIVPMVSPVLGPFVTGLASYIGWGAGSIIAFWIARTWGQPVVFKLIDKESIEKTRQYIDEDMSLLFVVALRMTIPADALSYVLGLFTVISYRVYILATMIGIAWFSFGFAYLGDSLMNGNYVLLIPISVASIFILYFLWVYIKKRQRNSG